MYLSSWFHLFFQLFGMKVLNLMNTLKRCILVVRYINCKDRNLFVHFVWKMPTNYIWFLVSQIARFYVAVLLTVDLLSMLEAI